ncbi:hypothetical protein Bca52824_003159 [Brassica carinata]|uniref:Uncharacterized protein n=1 Tax=Brassica carinata TaxID=52824 RepID=A0A8X7WJD6_BRACI|nr:hypothetical protein Bca52824_003159 [Brassica carinata]
MAKRGFKSLMVAIAAHVILTLFATYFLGTSGSYMIRARSFSWIPPPWVLHTMCLASSGLMGLAVFTFMVGSGKGELALWLGQSGDLDATRPLMISLVASNLVKPCLAFAAFVATINVKLAIA